MIFFITIFRYFIFLFYSFHCLSFPFPRDADSRKGSLCPFCVPIHKKKRTPLLLIDYRGYLYRLFFPECCSALLISWHGSSLDKKLSSN